MTTAQRKHAALQVADLPSSQCATLTRTLRGWATRGRNICFMVWGSWFESGYWCGAIADILADWESITLVFSEAAVGLTGWCTEEAPASVLWAAGVRAGAAAAALRRRGAGMRAVVHTQSDSMMH